MNRILLSALLMLLSLEGLAEVSARTDRMNVSLLELVNLTVSIVNESADATPDFDVLSKDWEMVGQPSRSSNTQVSIIQGQRNVTEEVRYTVALRPRREGSLWIPPIPVGSARTSALPVNVSPPGKQEQRYVFFENSVDTRVAYVQSQIIYTLKLFYTEAIGGDFPAPPTIPEAVIETIEDQNRYTAVSGGRRYNVMEVRYAIFPQQSGEVIIPAATFRGTRGRGGLFGTRQNVSAVSPEIVIQVKSRPPGFSGDNWIAARAFRLSEQWAQNPPRLRVGEPVNRVLRIDAAGLAGSLLPPIQLPDVPGLKTYADPPETTERTGEQGLEASSLTTVGIVPTRAGEITLPEIRIPWWNITTDSEEVAIIPAATFEVLASEGPQVVAPVPVPVSPVTTARTVQAPTTSLWLYVTLALSGLWILTLWQWWQLRSRLNALEPPEPAVTVQSQMAGEDELFDDLSRACKQDRAADAHRSLFLWSNARFGTGSLQELAVLSGDEELSTQIIALESALYGRNSDSEWHGVSLLKLIETLRHQQVRSASSHDLIDQLNPI